jgi:Protein of unknown function (DUF1350)
MGKLILDHTFEKLSSSWVSIHPNPKGIIQFIGGAFYGTAPTFHYRYFLDSLFEAGYTIVALPFKFTVHHWSVSLQLLAEHYRVRQAIIEAILNHPAKSDYQYDVYLEAANYHWVGHSLGCKYIILLEVLNDGLEKVRANIADLGIERSQDEQIQIGLNQAGSTLQQVRQAIHQLTHRWVDFDEPFIHNETSLLLAPVIAELDAAIPLRSLRRAFEQVGFKVVPTLEQTYRLIAKSDSFNLMEIIQFQQDALAKQTCVDLAKAIHHDSPAMLTGKHLEPIGLQIGNYIADLNPLDKFIQPIQTRQLEQHIIQELR